MVLEEVLVALEIRREVVVVELSTMVGNGLNVAAVETG
jgi:hypothetical protein